MNLNIIEESVINFINSIPSSVTLVAAAKTRTPFEVQTAIHAGIKIIGYNYLKEAELMHKFFGMGREGVKMLKRIFRLRKGSIFFKKTDIICLGKTCNFPQI